ncbi:Electron transport complex subunit RsxB [anaerobic digester metagenome]
MKTAIVYYSQTGNTKKIASAIFEGMHKEFETVDLIPVINLKASDILKTYDIIGIGCPVWCMKEPGIIGRLLADLKEVDGKQAFLFCTHATLIGGFFERLIPILQEKGLKVLGWEDWFGGKVNPTVEGPYYTDGHPDDVDLQEARAFGQEMAARSILVVRGHEVVLPKLPEGEDYVRRYGSLEKIAAMVTATSKKTTHTRAVFYFDSEKCTSCGLCTQFCPSKSINPSNKVPLSEESCEHCHFCELICPSGAISFSGKLRIDPQNPFTEALMAELIENRELRRFRHKIDLSMVGTVMPSEEILAQHPYLWIDQDVAVLKR